MYKKRTFSFWKRPFLCNDPVEGQIVSLFIIIWYVSLPKSNFTLFFYSVKSNQIVKTFSDCLKKNLQY